MKRFIFLIPLSCLLGFVLLLSLELFSPLLDDMEFFKMEAARCFAIFLDIIVQLLAILVILDIFADRFKLKGDNTSF